MNAFTKGPIVVLGPDEGESFWQPLPSRGYIVNKLTPYNTPHDSFSLGIQVLEPGAHIRRHAHERQHEVLFCYAGEGWAEVEGARHEVRPETTLLIGRAAWHTVRNTGKRADAPVVDDRAGGAGGLVPRYREAAAAGGGDARGVRTAGGSGGDPRAAAVRAGGVGRGTVSPLLRRLKTQRRLARHAYSNTSDHHKHISDTPFTHPAFSAAATPFGWLLKDRAWGHEVGGREDR